jgi:hypothetical protein
MKQRKDSALSTPVQVLEAKGMEASSDVPIEAVACVVTTGVDPIQLGNQGHPQGSSSATLPFLLSICLQQSMPKRLTAVLQLS